jgi:hypothetical protein
MIHTTLPGISSAGYKNFENSGSGFENDISSLNKVIGTICAPKYAYTICGIRMRMNTRINRS